MQLHKTLRRPMSKNLITSKNEGSIWSYIMKNKFLLTNILLAFTSISLSLNIFLKLHLSELDLTNTSLPT